MAGKLIVLALVLIGLLGLVSAANDAPANATTPKSSGTASSPGSQGGSEAAAAPGNDDAIGNTDDAGAPTNSNGGGDEGVAVEGPIGSEDAANSAASSAQPPTSGAITFRVSAVAGAAAAVAGYFVF
ncbi:anther-specific protein BCP1-like [Durio zibethinus]|uniref:Anther-specific protein BCP1-like n=1 Tax=Durio zibethinus TaxID=66656 RepID=A0A6P5XZU0_DURZI|nr:anther-specific protein BCP1-like [Durio zibethinus]